MYLIDGRGQQMLRSLGLSIFERLIRSAVAMADAKIGVLTPKGLTERVNPIKEHRKGQGLGQFQDVPAISRATLAGCEELLFSYCE